MAQKERHQTSSSLLSNYQENKLGYFIRRIQLRIFLKVFLKDILKVKKKNQGLVRHFSEKRPQHRHTACQI